MALYVRKVQLSPVVWMGHVKTLEKTSCKYPVRRVEVKVDTVPTGNMNYVQNNLFLGQLPKRLVIACVDSDALNGTIGKTPFDFKHYKINCVALNVDGRQIPAKPLQPDFENNGYIRSYMGLIRKNVSRRRKYHFERRLYQRKHLAWIWSHTRHVWSWSLSTYITGQLESGDSFRRCPYSYHQRDHVCRIWQRHWNW